MVTYTVRISHEAGESLRGIYFYLRSKMSDEAADKVIDGILDTIDSLENFPGSHEREHFLNTSADDIEYRRTFSNNYRIVFAIDEEEVVVEVFDVLRSERSERTVIKRIKK